MSRSGLVRFAAVTALFTLVAFPAIDRPVAEFIRASGWEGAWIFSAGTALFDTISGKNLSKFLPGLALAVAGGMLMVPARFRRRGTALLFVGAAHVLSTLICGMSKNVFGRLRPFELLEAGNWDQVWFVAGGNSFPSGHAGYYFGLFLPLVYLFPRRRWALLAIPFFIAAARIIENLHFLSDVTASMAVAAVITAVLAGALAPAPRDSGREDRDQLTVVPQ
ncbi:MAG: phosphatase PAP2 family protein [Gammaproteobacteria bacterium]|nr:phosphatase PAP2 family protein [Gammaproteobacteria bacterium]